MNPYTKEQILEAGKAEPDKIENLMLLCRSCHIAYGDRKDKIEWLQRVHEKTLISKL